LGETESFDGASLCPHGFFEPILGWRIRFERAQQTGRSTSYLIYSSIEGDFVCFGRLVETADFSDELKRSGANLFGSDRRIKIEKRSDVPAHFALHL
jgi:hypothetical protein